MWDCGGALCISVFLNHRASVMTTCFSLSRAQLYRKALEGMYFESLGHLLLLVWLASSTKPRNCSHTTKLLFILKGIICASSSTYCQKHQLIHEQLLQNKAMNQFLTACWKLGHFPWMLQLFARAIYPQMEALWYFMHAPWTVSALQGVVPKRPPASPALRTGENSKELNASCSHGTPGSGGLVPQSAWFLDWCWSQLPEIQASSACVIHFSFMKWEN